MRPTSWRSRTPGYGYGRGTVYGLDLDQALPLMVGHPLIFRQDDLEVRVELIAGEPELQVIQTENELRLGLIPAFDEDQSVLLVEESPTRFKAISVTRQHRNIVGILGDKELKIPATAREKVLDEAQAIKNMATRRSQAAMNLQGEFRMITPPARPSKTTWASCGTCFASSIRASSARPSSSTVSSPSPSKNTATWPTASSKAAT
jgi:hypothetical protein